MSEVTAYIGQSIARIEEEQRLAEAQRNAEQTAQHQAEVRACALEILGDGLTRISERLDAFENRKRELAALEQRNAEEAEAKAIAEYLDSLPDPDAPDVETVVKDATHQPSGDMHSVGPVDTEHLDPEGEHRNEAFSGDKKTADRFRSRPIMRDVAADLPIEA
jgi:hypothetical protein